MNVSVVIPLYNKAAYIQRTLESVFAQTLPASEILVVDDGSTDDGGDVVQKIKHAGLRVISQTNWGVSAARNRGVLEAAHGLIAFLDADDEWQPNFLRMSVAMHTEHPGLAASFTNFSKGPHPHAMLRPAGGMPRLLDDYFAFALANSGAGMNSSSVVASRANLTAIGGFPVGRTHGEDLDTWMRLAWSGPIAFIPEPLSVYHQECGASTAGLSNLDVLPTYREWSKLERIPAKLRRSSRAFTLLCRYRTAFSHARAGQKQSALRLYRDLPPTSRLNPLGLASLLTILNYPAGKYAFYAAEVLNRVTCHWQWRASVLKQDMLPSWTPALALSHK